MVLVNKLWLEKSSTYTKLYESGSKCCKKFSEKKINYFLKISMDSPATVAIDGEPAKVSNFSLTDLPKHIRSLF